MSNTRTAVFLALALSTPACESAGLGGDSVFRGEAAKFLARYEATYRHLWEDREEALWSARTRILVNDDADLARVQSSEEALCAFTGSLENIGLARACLSRKDELPPIVRQQLDRVLFLAGGNPGMVPDLVRARIGVEAHLEKSLFGFGYELEKKRVRLEELDAGLGTERDLARRRAAWRAAQAPGAPLRADFVRLRALRNQAVSTIGFDDYFAYRSSEYGMPLAEFVRKVEEIEREMRPLYAELHTFLRYELAQRYGQPVPDLIPAHWLSSRFGQDCSALFERAVPERSDPAQRVADEAERVYVGLGFEPLPPSFWDRSSLSAMDSGAASSRASLETVRHVDLERDVRALASLDGGSGAFARACRVLGQAHATLAYAIPELPILLRRGASRAFHEAIGELVALAAGGPRARVSRGLAPGEPADPMRVLLDEALEFVVAVPWSAGTLFQFEREIYAEGLPAARWNARFWALAARHQGIAPPEPRDERWCDPVTAPGLVDRPAEGCDRAIACALAFELHDHIARKILDQDPRDADYVGRREAGNYLRSILRRGAGTDWRFLLREKTGYDISARAMADYFEPLRLWLAERNAGRPSSLPPL